MTQKASDQFGWVSPGDNWRSSAIVGCGPPADDADIAYGFQLIANIALDYCVAHGPDDGLLVPILYNYRHAVELLLKQALRQAWMCESHYGIPPPTFPDRNKTVSGDEWLATTHDLNALVGELGICFAVLNMQPADQVIPPDVTTTISKLHDLDPRGDAFRYAQTRRPIAGTFRHDRPADKDKFVQVEEDDRKVINVEYVDVEHLREVLDNAITYLQGSVDYLTMYREDTSL